MTTATMPIDVRPSPIHGHGVFAATEVVRGTVVGRYEGKRYGPGETPSSRDASGMTYLFMLSDGSIIDGAEGGNATRHLNHSCRPNCEAREASGDDGSLRVEIIAKRLIRSGEELFIDYELVIDPDDRNSHACACGSERCRGTMAAKRVVKRLS